MQWLVSRICGNVRIPCRRWDRLSCGMEGKKTMNLLHRILEADKRSGGSGCLKGTCRCFP